MTTVAFVKNAHGFPVGLLSIQLANSTWGQANSSANNALDVSMILSIIIPATVVTKFAQGFTVTTLEDDSDETKAMMEEYH